MLEICFTATEVRLEWVWETASKGSVVILPLSLNFFSVSILWVSWSWWFYSAGNWTQGLAHARETLCQLGCFPAHSVVTLITKAFGFWEALVSCKWFVQLPVLKLTEGSLPSTLTVQANHLVIHQDASFLQENVMYFAFGFLIPELYFGTVTTKFLIGPSFCPFSFGGR